MKAKRLIAVILSACMVTGMFSSCGQQPSAQNIIQEEQKTAADSSGENAVTEAPAEEEEEAPEDAFMADAEETARELEEIRAEAESIADVLYEINYTSAQVWDWDEEQQEADPETYEYGYQNVIDTGAENIEAIGALRDRLSDVGDTLKAQNPDTEEGKKIKKQMNAAADKMDTILASMEEIIVFFQEQSDLQDPLTQASNQVGAAEDVDTYLTGLQEMYSELLKLQNDFNELHRPAALNPIFEKYTDTIAAFAQSIYYFYYGTGDEGSVLLNYNGTELIAWNTIVLTDYEVMMFEEMSYVYSHYSDVLGDTLKEATEAIEKSVSEWTVPDVSEDDDIYINYDMIDSIYPNQYSTIDSVINLTLGACEEGRELMITAEVEGFTQTYEQKVTAGLEPKSFMIKPSVLIDLPDMTTQRSTQLEFTIKDLDTGKTLVKESKNITIYSVYDFFAYNDEFGKTAMFDLLGWLRPESNAVELVRRQAISYLEAYFGSSNAMLPGYQGAYGYDAGDVYITAIQVAAIQKAISDLGVRYNMDAYSFSDAQRVLTADQVIAKKSGICIETSVLMASVLMSAGLHPMLILIPGHAQVAVETWSGSGSYLLIETTLLPYDGIQVTSDGLDFGYLFDYSVQSEEEWRDYLASQEEIGEMYGGLTYVLDCDLRVLLHKSGLENIQATIDTEGVKYNTEDTSPAQEETPAAESGGAEGSGETADSGAPSYLVVVGESQNYSFLVYDTVTGYVDEYGTAVISLMGNDDYPFMEVSRESGDFSAKEYLEKLKEQVIDHGLITEDPGEPELTDYSGLSVYSLVITTEVPEDGYVSHLLVAMDTEDSSVLFIDAYTDGTGVEEIYEAIDLVLMSFMPDYTAYGT